MNAKASFSFEIFPPRKSDSIDKIYTTLEQLKDLKPDFISVTFGAGGSINSQNTLDIASLVQDRYKTSSIVHLPCIHQNKAQISSILNECKKRGLQKILALRGDIVEGKEKSVDFAYASDLVRFIKEQGDFEIYAACYPEKHNEALNFTEDIHHLKEKVDAGANTLLTQLFFDNEDFYRFKEYCDIANIKAEIKAGIMPIANKRQVLKITSMCGSKIPAKFAKILHKYEHNDKAMIDAGIAYAIDQIVDLLTNGVSGIHLYTMNNAYVAKKVFEATHSLFEA
ncbi:methylenetetrahydrofolate reductase [NAD(P)H] [Campylobacter sp. MIT 12-8780]|uniref:methylenetetrahydrofolate reductase [NAD(P)H] n=1 Tax=unclassified Campylobacter TaxID=2593542 RepID=UPI00115E9612|nr:MULTISPECIES: methylenetetrahydrofolate reductase [NAD(P)H] [unclassified Campylobacter]NDJ27727.1 methylenetetrahydrofolate reductase [NAD(P)H] [Campylobacter sp. MIT 19-121]TQR41065.1 methylenetetrahydrofolate reductase [NAD(P)H] [Campylobacter sp. MIT 12-8780]